MALVSPRGIQFVKICVEDRDPVSHEAVVPDCDRSAGDHSNVVRKPASLSNRNRCSGVPRLKQDLAITPAGGHPETEVTTVANRYCAGAVEPHRDVKIKLIFVNEPAIGETTDQSRGKKVSRVLNPAPGRPNPTQQFPDHPRKPTSDRHTATTDSAGICGPIGRLNVVAAISSEIGNAPHSRSPAYATARCGGTG